MTYWKTSSSHQSRQRLAQREAPLHVRQRFTGAPLSNELRGKYGLRTVSLRRGDTVRVLRGDAKGLEGKVARVNLTKSQIQVEGITQKKVDGSTVLTPIHPSKVMVTKLDLDDKRRAASLERGRLAERKKEEKK